LEQLRERPVLVEEAYRAILAAIADGRLAAGQRLQQESLAELLGVSRQPISHALALLRQEGFVVEGAGTRGRRGVMVAPLSADYVKSLYEVRAALDSTAARLAAEAVASGRRAPRERKALGDALRAGERALAEGDRAGLVEADVAFHRALNELSGNKVICETAERQWGHVRRAMGAVLADAHQVRTAWLEHRAIAAAVLAGDTAEAERLTRAHAERAGRETHQRLLAREPAAA
jgi:DNA-binding GntR family transcriptional regulator